MHGHEEIQRRDRPPRRRFAEGKPREILERITFERTVGDDGSLSEPVVVNRRFDLRTGEVLNRLSDTEFEEDETGARLHLRA